jgi:hypothetical protein
MSLKAPGIVTFMLSIIIMVCAIVVRFFDAQIPFIRGNEFFALFFAYLVLVLGCLMRRL